MRQKYKNNNSIAVFDSGIGGLTFLSIAAKALPHENFIYYGDNKNAPYGNLPHAKIIGFAMRAFSYFKKAKVKAVVVACNTVTSECIDVLRSRFAYKIIGMEPAIKPACKNLGTTAVICTKATARSSKFLKLAAMQKNLHVLEMPDLAGEIEKGLLKNQEPNLSNLQKQHFDNVVLGCTHYIFIKQKIANIAAAKVFDGNIGTLEHLTNYIAQSRLQNTRGGKIKFVGSGKRKNKKIYRLIKRGLIKV